jgi:hypothetical protein
MARISRFTDPRTLILQNWHTLGSTLTHEQKNGQIHPKPVTPCRFYMTGSQ